MLEPNYLQNVGDDLEKLYQELATEILVDIAERIKMNQDAMTSTTEYLNNKLKQLGLQQDWINKRLAEILHTSEEEVDRIMQQSAYKSIRDTFDRGWRIRHKRLRIFESDQKRNVSTVGRHPEPYKDHSSTG